MLIYKQTYIDAKIDLTSLEEEGYDPNKLEPKSFDDSTPLDLAKLEQNTFLLPPSSEKTKEVDPPPAGQGDQPNTDPSTSGPAASAQPPTSHDPPSSTVHDPQ